MGLVSDGEDGVRIGDLPGPDVPSWYAEARARQPERHVTIVDNIGIEWLAWGDPAAPGLMLLHGAYAHAHWWRAVGGLLADRYRIVAPSFAGMGHSGWRERYGHDLFAAEPIAVAADAGLFAHGRPVIAAHSFGATVAIRSIARDARFAGLILIDRAVNLTVEGKQRPVVPATRRRYADLAEARSRFRLFPEEPAPDFILRDVIADGLDPAPEGGFHASYDPGLLAQIEGVPSLAEHVAQARCPLAFIRGEASPVFDAARDAENRTLTPPGTPHLTIAGAGHHIPLQQPVALATAIDTLARAF